MMTALAIVGEAAKRLTIMLPTTIVVPTKPDQDSIDYDANLLVSCLNATIQQNARLNLFKKEVIGKAIEIKDDPSQQVSWLANNVDNPVVYKDFCFQLKDFGDIEKIEGEGFTVSLYTKTSTAGDPTPSDTFQRTNMYIFRQLTFSDFEKVQRGSAIGLVEPSSSKKSSQNPHVSYKERKEYYKNMPSEDRTKIVDATNKESGFSMLVNDGNLMYYFCNNMIPISSIGDNVVAMLEFFYTTNRVVMDANGKHKDVVDDDHDTCLLPDELLILGTIINYKSAYGLDFSLDLGQQKALIDAIKENQENLQVTHLDKKEYYRPRM
jgi:hypothetical protein